MGLATQQDLEDIWRPLTSDEVTSGRFTRLLDTAEALLRQQLPNLDDRIALAGTDVVYGLNPVVVRLVIASIVKRYLANPSGASTATTGPFSVSFVDRYAGADGTAAIRGTLSVTASDLAQLKPVSPKASIGTINVKPGMGLSRQDSRLLALADGCLPVMLRPDAPE